MNITKDSNVLLDAIESGDARIDDKGRVVIRLKFDQTTGKLVPFSKIPRPKPLAKVLPWRK